MRLMVAIVVLVVGAGAIAFTLLNAGTITIDFRYAQVSAPLGIVLLAVLLVGWLLGGVTAWLGRARTPRRRASTAMPTDAAAEPSEPRDATRP